MQVPYLISILVIDEIPLIRVGLQEVFRTIDPAIRVEYTDSVFRALSSREYENKRFHLVILGSDEEKSSESLLLHATELKQRFGQPLIMIYSSAYHPIIIEKMPTTGIDAYVHKYESIPEILHAYEQLSKGEAYVSGIFHTLYYEYGHGVRK
ncbi:MAG TPA: hypothetical protein VK518_20205 [Puia sp.]|nr:hypothetical protein [Puia sp.]